MEKTTSNIWQRILGNKNRTSRKEIEIELPIRQEVINTIKSLTNNKSQGITAITAEIIETVGELLHERISTIRKKVWDEERKPEDWTKAGI